MRRMTVLNGELLISEFVLFLWLNKTDRMDKDWTLEKLGNHKYRHHRLWENEPQRPAYGLRQCFP